MCIKDVITGLIRQVESYHRQHSQHVQQSLVCEMAKFLTWRRRITIDLVIFPQ